MNTRPRNSKKKQAKFLGASPPFNSQRSKKIKKFSCKGDDGREMKVYLGLGCVPASYGINEFVEKFPQFSVYDRLSLGSAFNRLKKSANAIAFERGSRAKNNNDGKYIIRKKMNFICLFLYFT